MRTANRNLYQKLGFFNTPNVPQVRGLGFTHDGRIGSLVAFLSGAAFQFASSQERTQVVQFLLGFDTDLAPVVGQQLTLDSAPSPATGIASTSCALAPPKATATWCSTA